jgi:hypothetical protein
MKTTDAMKHLYLAILLAAFPIFAAVQDRSEFGAREAHPSMTRFNVQCPYQRLKSTLEKSFSSCTRGDPAACDRFLDTFKNLTVTSDCQRPFDATPTKKYIVPALWLAGDEKLERYVTLVASLKTPRARTLFASKEYRRVLDGYIVEMYREESLKAEKQLSKSLQPPNIPLQTDR